MALIRVLIKRPNEEAEVKEIENDWESFKEILDGGTLGSSYVGKGLWLYCDDNGKLKRLPYNFKYGLFDFVVGTCVFFRNVSGEYEQSLTDEQIEFLKQNLAKGYLPTLR